MFRTRLPRALSVAVIAVLLTAAPVGAHSGHTVTFDTTPNLTVTVVVGPYEVDTLTYDFDAGFRFAHADGAGTEVTPNPDDEEEIGTFTMRATWNVLGFCNTNTQTSTITWEDGMTGAPVGAVAHWVVTSPLGFATDAWVIEESDANDDYKVTLDLDEGRTCATQPNDSYATLDVLQTTASGGHPYDPPNGPGCPSVSVTVGDTSGSSHSGSDSAC